jgi:outer membrane protein assembly factor BamB
LGIATDKGLPTTWSAETGIAWKTAMPGPGASSPIVVGDKVFVTCYSGYGLDRNDPGDMKSLRRHLVCVDRTEGKVLWTRDVPAVVPEQKFAGNYITLHGYASSTPVSDGERVYVFFGKSGVHAFDLDGKPLWQASVGTRTHGFGSGASPILYKNLLIVNASAESATLVALDKTNGKQVWAVPKVAMSWSMPLVVRLPNRDELVLSVPDYLRAFDPQSGAEIWSCRFKGNLGYVDPSPVAHDGVVYAMRLGTVQAVRAGGKGDVTASHLLWTAKSGSNVTSPVYYAGHVYWASDGAGTVYCVTADKGSVVYKERLRPPPDKIYASPLFADGKLYYVSRDAGAFVLEALPKFHVLAHNTIRDDPSVFNGSIAVSHGRLLLRSDRYLYAIGKQP